MKLSMKLLKVGCVCYVLLLGLFVVHWAPSCLFFIGRTNISVIPSRLESNHYSEVTSNSTAVRWNVRTVVDLIGLPSDTKEVINVIVLAHGFMGNSKELLHMEQTLTRYGKERNELFPQKRWIVHSAAANEYKTFDGIVAGGHRLALEINDLLQKVKEQHSSLKSKITLSIVGSSLGGLYARYALSEINFDDIKPMVFTTIATPHLGVDSNTYVPLPRYVESIAAKLLLQTGSDLFRFSTVIDQLAVDDKFIRPLKYFQHRRSYANAFHTDHVVPLRTAAFLSSTINSEHYFHPIIGSNSTDTGKKYISIVVKTPKKTERQIQSCSADSMCNFTYRSCTNNDGNKNRNNERSVDVNNNDHRITLDEMSVRLDSLGWTKVFCDMRDTLPPIPKSLFSWLFTTSTEGDGTGSMSTSAMIQSVIDIPNLSVMKTTANDDNIDSKGKSKKQQPNIFSSSELLKQYGSTGSKRLVVPAGHSMLGAHAHFPLFGYINSGGRPIVEHISDELIEQITQLPV